MKSGDARVALIGFPSVGKVWIELELHGILITMINLMIILTDYYGIAFEMIIIINLS